MRRLNPFEDIEDSELSPERPVRARLASAASLLGLGFLLAFHFALMASWARRETRPPAWDQAIHLEISLDSRKALLGRDYDALLHPVPKPGMPPFPPLYHLSLAYAHDRPDPALAALWANFGYMALFCLALWGMGRLLFGPWQGLAAAALLSCSPEVQNLYLSQLVDLALAAWVAAAYWAVLASDAFRRRVPSLLAGACLGAAMLTKWSAFSYFLPVLLLAWRAQGRERLNVWLMGLAAVALAGPWYAAQWPVLLPRLVDASADNALAVWRSGALLAYLNQMANGLDTPFWMLGLTALALATVRSPLAPNWFLPVWFLSAYAFWTVVPNRQLRYLLPALPPLALLAPAAWPRALIGALCAYQAFAAANYSHGWVKPIDFQAGIRVSFLRSEPPAAQDWRIGEILRAAASLHEPDAPFGNLALVANHPQFNGANFNWEADRLGIEKVRIRGVNRRLCEFAEFLLVKTGSLGPEPVVVQLPEVQRLVLDGSSWFQRGYRERRRWPLPDGSEAVLFQRRKLAGPPVGEREVEFDYYEEHDFLARGMRVDLGRWDAERGVYPRVRVRADTVDLRGLQVRGVEAVLEDVAMVPVDTDILRMGKARRRSPRELLMDFRFLEMRRLTLAAGTIDEKAAAEFLAARLPALHEPRFSLADTVSAEAKVGGLLPVGARAEVSMSPDALLVRLRSIALAGIPLPVRILGRHAGYRLDFAPDPELPFELRIAPLSIRDGRLKIGN